MAFLVSYNTPRAGLSCRSLTYLVYGVSQVCGVSLWLWECWLKVQYGPQWSVTKTWAKALSWWGQVFVGFFGIFTTVGGTMMQVLGVYRTCACRVSHVCPISHQGAAMHVLPMLVEDLTSI
jgi:hypothetical protein